MAKEKQQSDSKQKDVVSTSVGNVHVMPSAYQGGKMPTAPIAKEEKKPANHEVKPKPSPKPLPPSSSLKNKLPLVKKKSKMPFIIIGGAVLIVVLIVVAIVVFSSPEPEPVAPTAPPILIEPTPSPTPVEEPPVIPEPEPEPVPDPFVPEPTPGRDTDSDGLSDIEERLYGSNVRLPDTDRDGFLDGNEIFHGYDPTLPDSVTLLSRGLVKQFVGSSYFLYPSIWTEVTEVVGADSFTTISISSGEEFILTFTSKDEAQSLLETLTNDPELKDGVSTLQSSVSKAGFPVMTSRDQLMAYVDFGGVLVSVKYSLGDKSAIDFLGTFQMLIGSLVPAVSN